MRVRAECGASEGPRRHGRPALHEGPAPRSHRVPRRQDSAQRRAPPAQPGGGSGARPGGAEGAGRGGGCMPVIIMFYGVFVCLQRCVHRGVCMHPGQADCMCYKGLVLIFFIIFP